MIAGLERELNPMEPSLRHLWVSGQQKYPGNLSELERLNRHSEARVWKVRSACSQLEALLALPAER